MILSATNEVLAVALDLNPAALGGGLVGAWAIGFMLIVLIVHVAFAIGVYSSATSLEGEPELVGPGIWTLATLIMGPLMALAYWAIHHSALKNPDR